MKIYSIDEYLKAPKNRRQTWWGWYKEPDGYEWTGIFDEECPFENFWKKNYPIQYFLREDVGSFFRRMKYRLNDCWYNIKCFFFPKQRWLTKTIPNTWCDKVALLPDIVFASLIHFVEEEEGLNSRTWKDTYPDGSSFDITHIEKDLRRAYRYATKVRGRLEKKTWQTKYPHSIYFDKLYNKCETHYAMLILQHREYLWT